MKINKIDMVSNNIIINTTHDYTTHKVCLKKRNIKNEKTHERRKERDG